jgi:hypothetical protein
MSGDKYIFTSNSTGLNLSQSGAEGVVSVTSALAGMSPVLP